MNPSAHSGLGFRLQNLQNEPILPWRQPANNVNEKIANGDESYKVKTNKTSLKQDYTSLRWKWDTMP